MSKVAEKASSSVEPRKKSTQEMVEEALKQLNERNGSSYTAIKNYIAGRFGINMETHQRFIKLYLNKAVEAGSIKKTKGTAKKGVNGSFKLMPKDAIKKSSDKTETKKGPKAKAGGKVVVKKAADKKPKAAEKAADKKSKTAEKSSVKKAKTAEKSSEKKAPKSRKRASSVPPTKEATEKKAKKPRSSSVSTPLVVDGAAKKGSGKMAKKTADAKQPAKKKSPTKKQTPKKSPAKKAPAKKQKAAKAEESSVADDKPAKKKTSAKGKKATKQTTEE